MTIKGQKARMWSSIHWDFSIFWSHFIRHNISDIRILFEKLDFMILIWFVESLSITLFDVLLIVIFIIALFLKKMIDIIFISMFRGHARPPNQSEMFNNLISNVYFFSKFNVFCLYNNIFYITALCNISAIIMTFVFILSIIYILFITSLKYIFLLPFISHGSQAIPKKKWICCLVITNK